MNREENIKKMYEQAKLDTITEKDKAVLEQMKEIYQHESKAEPKTSELSLWRIIMKSKISKFAAAVIIFAVITISFFYIGTEEVYAIDQTIEAMRKITTVHCFINLFTEQRMEVWCKVNPETGENEYFHMSMPGMIMVSTPQETYRYNEAQNVVIHLKGDGHVVSDIRFGRFIEDMTEIAHSNNGKIEFEESILEGKSVILVMMENDQATLESIVDPVTKLPISMNFKPKGELQPGQLGQSIEDFTFNEPLPEGIFDFVIPEGAKVIEQ